MTDLLPRVRNMTALNEVQARILTNMGNSLQFSANLTHNQVFLCAYGKSKGTLALLACKRPSFSSYPMILEEGKFYSSNELSIIHKVLSSGEKVIGRRELDLGRMADLTCYPIVDNAGVPFAVLGLVSRISSQPQVLMDTASLLIQFPLSKEEYYPLRPQDGVIILDSVGRIIFSNDAAAGLYFVLDKEAADSRKLIGRSLIHFPLVDQVMVSGRPAFGDVKQGDYTVSAWALPLMSAGRMKRAVLVLTDVTAVREREKQILVKDYVIKEIHHRVKNSLAMTASLLRLQARRAKSAEAKTELNQAVSRISNISEIHDMLSHAENDHVPLIEMLERLAHLSISALASCPVELKVSGDPVFISSEQAVPMAIAAGEIMHNAISHGFEGEDQGTLVITVIREKDQICMTVSNSGNLLPEGWSMKSSHLGLQIVKNIIETQFQGHFSLKNSGENVVSCFVFPEKLLGDKKDE